MDIENLLDAIENSEENVKMDMDLVAEHFNKIFECVEGKGLNDFNGHFWVENEYGEIIDDYDWSDDIENIKEYVKPDFNFEIKYEKCDDTTTNEIVIRMLKQILTKNGLRLPVAYKLFGLLWSPQKRACMFNAVANHYKNPNFKIVFGSVYFPYYHTKIYLSGGVNFKTFHDFKKKETYLDRIGFNLSIGI